MEDVDCRGASRAAQQSNLDDSSSKSDTVPSFSPTKKRSLSDGSSSTTQPVLSPSPKFREPQRRVSKDDSALISETPSTPLRSVLPRGLSLHMPPRQLMSPSSSRVSAPLSPKLDPSSIYGSPASVLPRRSRGLDFSRAATNLHHSTLAKPSSPDASPTIGGRAMNIPGRRGGAFTPSGDSSAIGAFPGTAGPDRMAISSSLGSLALLGSDSSGSSSDDDDLMDADEPEENILNTPQVYKHISAFGSNNITASPGTGWMTGTSSAAVSSLMNFQRARLRHGKSRKSSSSGSGSSKASPISRSPPPGSTNVDRRRSSMHSRRESISWAANQLRISGNDSDDGGGKPSMDSADGISSTPGVIRRVVTRRGNLLPKPKIFSRIQAALAEESTPVESEVRREADVIRQVRESDMTDEPRYSVSNANTAHSSPSLMPAMNDSLGDIPEDDLMGDISTSLSSSFKEHAMRNSKGREFWDKYDKRTPPPPAAFLPRGSTSGISDDMFIDQVSQSPSRATTPQPGGGRGDGGFGNFGTPTTAELTRKINNKRRRGDDDFDLDPSSLKRRAVSPGVSVHNSPIIQSPMQREGNPWGPRPSTSSNANGREQSGNTSASERGSLDNGNGSASTRGTGTKRVGMQGMADTSDGMMKMSIE